MSASRPKRWNGAVIVLHWTAAALILALVAIGRAMVHGGLDAARAFDLFQLHESLGFAVLALTLARVVARGVVGSPAR